LDRKLRQVRRSYYPSVLLLNEDKELSKINNTLNQEKKWSSDSKTGKDKDLRKFVQKKEGAPQPIPGPVPEIIRSVPASSRKPIDIGDTKAAELENKGMTIVSQFNTAKNPYELKAMVNEAISLLEEALNSDPHTAQIPHLYYGLGLCYLRLGEWLASEEFFRKSVEAEPNYVPSYEGCGEALYMQGHYENALGWFTKFVDTFPEFYGGIDPTNQLSSEHILASILFKRGMCYFHLKDMVCAAGDFNTVVDLDVAHVAMAFRWLGKIASIRGKWWDSVALLSKAIKKDPNLLGAYMDRSDAFAALNKNEESQEDWKMYQILRRKALWKNLPFNI
jgi:tetratricopeptide (TPR) repeat protein